MTELNEVVKELKSLNDLEKEIKAKKDNLRAELFDYGVQDYDGKEWLLPTTTITVPKTFWLTSIMTPKDFIESRFPTWDLLSVEEDPAMFITIFVLRKKPLYMPYKYEDDNYKLSKSVTEPTPEIDWETLTAERPDLFDKLAKPVIHWELDGEVLEEMLKEDDELRSILTRHTKYNREPQQRVAIKELE